MNGHTGQRRRLLGGLLAAGAATLLPPARAALAVAPACAPWREWTAFVGKHLDASGRVIDFQHADRRSTSEGQSYALFFALVANDQVLFERVLGWTRHNLCGGRPQQVLPAWLWGRASDGSWRVLDGNSASDADLWIAYVLLEAGRLWQRPGYTQAGLQMLALVRRTELAELPGFGSMLLPAAKGFVRPQRWTLNPSYLPLQLLRRFAAVDPKGPWAGLATRSARMLRDSAPVGFAPDWTSWDGRAFGVDPDKGAIGSYDAIRVYLWAGMLDAADPLRKALLDDLSGPLQQLRAQGRLDEKIDSRQGVGSGQAPPGFAAALLPYLSALREPALLQAQAQRIPAPGDAAAARLPYYDRVLILFGRAWLDNRYRFSADGALQPAWRTQCSA
ncbi:cellulose synthase complex periplasmic endoglucanase BcsZ [Xanthomonas sontii]|uniref:cellulose synthase complex periplasmic endoglucanase BcsZ n=1 Tax=Xanthomonas sontii TaxID=2650745 RepID=UPI0011E3FE60|nr:cellulose synthase complex periplasmic endoglucanase BcsZ [Xanthomonas sontii]MDQ7761110.1 cellulose synthase complex periplasmic endoglucanase BcsZ [Xanthomonas sontii]TYD32184.1 endo-1,4-D-glucanase [Xanthomonas sontii]UZK08434.1 cellulase [Xanthomonas sontii]